MHVCIYKYTCAHIYARVCVYNVCVHLTEIKCLFGVFPSFTFQGCKEYVSTHVCRRPCGAHEHTTEANESDWESVLASSDQLLLTPKAQHSVSVT